MDLVAGVGGSKMKEIASICQRRQRNESKSKTFLGWNLKKLVTLVQIVMEELWPWGRLQ